MQNQTEKHQQWVKEEGDLEHPTHLETLLKPEQQVRIAWLKKHCYPATDILDLGCNWGYVLNEVNGKCGVDINPENIDKAMREFPTRSFLVADIAGARDSTGIFGNPRDKLPFEDKQYAIVILADVLEHLQWDADVFHALNAGLRIARRKLLITLPWRKDDEFALCFKHRWVPWPFEVGAIITCIAEFGHRVFVECDDTFIYLEVLK